MSHKVLKLLWIIRCIVNHRPSIKSFIWRLWTKKQHESGGTQCPVTFIYMRSNTLTSEANQQHAVNSNLWTVVPSASGEQMILLKLFNLVCEIPPLPFTTTPAPTPLIHRPLNLQCLWSSPRIQKSLNSFWQSLGRVSRGASSTELHTAGRIYYAEKKKIKIRGRHSVTRSLPEREQSWECWGLWAGRWPSKTEAGWENAQSREKWITGSLFQGGSSRADAHTGAVKKKKAVHAPL